jgi:hypothetical protein
MGDWLGTGRIATGLRKFRPFVESRAFARNLDLNSAKEWRLYCKSDPRARRDDRGSGPARAWKQSQAVIVSGVSLEEAAPPARQDDAETASIIVNGCKGLHGHRGAP